MKQQILIAAIASVFSAAAQAQWHVEAAYGGSSMNLSCGSGIDCDSSDRGARIAFGTNPKPWLGFEMGFTDYGSLVAKTGTNPAVTFKPRAVYGAAVFTQTVGSTFRFFGRAGVAAVQTTTTSRVSGSFRLGQYNHSNIAPVVGGGIGFSITPNLSLQLSADASVAKVEDDLHSGVQFVGGSVRYEF